MNAELLHAPMAGWAAPLDEVPDEVFAGRMMGEGLAIDPLEGVLRAPCDATVVTLPDSAHAVVLGLANGAELLIHVGIETVALRGRGFTAHVKAGTRVRQGERLISFDLDAVAREAKSLISPIVVTGDGHRLVPIAVDRAVTGGEPIARVEAADATAPIAAEGRAAEGAVTIGAAHGLHARPAARIAAVAKGFDAEIELIAGEQHANARSPVALMALALKQGDRALLKARGPEAEAAIDALTPFIAGLEDTDTFAPATAAKRRVAEAAEGVLQGVCASPGLALGPAAHFAVAEIDVDEHGLGADAERAALVAARAAVRDRIARSVDTGRIREAHLGLLDDPALLAAAEADIASGRSAGWAWRAATAAAAETLRATGSELLIERIDDLQDVARQLVAELAGVAEPFRTNFPAGAILLADNLLPSQLTTIGADSLGGVCLARGGPTSHVAILAASAGLPMLVAVGDGIAAIADGSRVILDATGGVLRTAPDAAELAEAEAQVAQRDERRRAETAAAAEDCRMADGGRIEIFANLASVAEARGAVAAGAEGCGLLRTEFLFHERATPPSEEEQRSAYAAVADALAGRPLIIRTLDGGGDKPTPWLALPPQDNPALGLRGVRISLWQPQLLATQLRAALTAAPGQVRIMVPMIVDIDELRAVRTLRDEAAAEAGVEPAPLGVMIETPAAALLADSLAAEADFLSVGTNDLSQYALAADRGNPATAERIDALHPAVLRLIATAAGGARRHDRPLGICGGIASDPLASAILIGLGATELSATPAAIPALKATVRRLRRDECETLAARALEAESAQAVRAMAAEAIE